MGILQGMSGNSAAQQDYTNQLAFQEANAKFARWQAGLNARISDANGQYNYWAETLNYNQNLSYAKSLRNVELLKSVRQAEIVRDTRAAAGAAFAQDSDALTAAFSEASMQEAVAHQQYQWRALQARASVQNMAMEGNSIDRLVNDYARQEGDYNTLQQINEGIRTRQYNRQQAAQVTQYLNRWNSQAFYEEQKVLDPPPPFAPLPALLQPSGPSMVGAPPSRAAGLLNIGSGLLSGVSSALSMNSQLMGLRTPSSPTGPGTN
jgi:hypothetical protein